MDPGPLSRRSRRAANKAVAAASSPLAKVPEEEHRRRRSRKGGSVETDDADSVERVASASSAAAAEEDEQSSSEISQDLTSSNSEQNASAAAAAGELGTTRDSTSGDDSFDVYAMVDESGAGPGAWSANDSPFFRSSVLISRIDFDFQQNITLGGAALRTKIAAVYSVVVVDCRL